MSDASHGAPSMSEATRIDAQLEQTLEQVFSTAAGLHEGSTDLHFDRALWSTLAELGFTRLTSVASGAGWIEAAGLLRAAGRHAAAVPVAENDVLAGWLVEQAGLPDDQSVIRTSCIVDVFGDAADVPWASEVDRIATSTQFNGINLLQGAAASKNFQVGIGTASTDRITVNFGGADATRLAVNGTAVTTFTNAQAAITALDAGIQSLSGVRGQFGAAMNRVNVAVASLQSMQTNTAASLSRIRDTDVANEAANLSRYQVLSQAGASVLAQANQSPQVALSLLR